MRRRRPNKGKGVGNNSAPTIREAMYDDGSYWPVSLIAEARKDGRHPSEQLEFMRQEAEREAIDRAQEAERHESKAA